MSIIMTFFADNLEKYMYNYTKKFKKKVIELAKG